MLRDGPGRHDASMDLLPDLCRFLDASPCPSLAADTIVADLGAAGFRTLDLANADWALAPGRYLVRRGAAVIAFIIRSSGAKRFHLVGAHTDSPHLRLKPRAPYHCEGCKQFAVEVYGGVLTNSWLDRDLGLAGMVYSSNGRRASVRIHKPLARVAQLAIHLDRKIQDEGLKLNAQNHLAPLWGLGGDAAAEFLELLAGASGIAANEISSHDLSLYDLTPAAIGGSRGEFLFSGRLDNLASCHAGVQALLTATDGNLTTIPVFAAFDHEEVGSDSDAGAGGPLLATTLERISLALGWSRATFLAALSGSVLLSADMAHAVHPNYVEKHEPRHKPQLGQGPVLKSNSNQRYATSGETAAYVRGLAKTAAICIQDFVTRSDLGCGSTIGPVTAANLGIAVADLGNPMLSMHSARECAATADHEPYVRLLAAHLRG